MTDQFVFTPVPKDVFRHPDISAFHQQDTDKRFQKIKQKNPDGTDRIDYTERDGVLIWHESFPYPERGLRDSYMMISVQVVKRNLMAWINFLSSKYLLPAYLALAFLPWKFKVRLLERFLASFESFSFIVDNCCYHFTMEKKYYSPFGQELMTGIEVFLKELGIKDSLSEGRFLVSEIATIMASLVDHDYAYRLRSEDILSETTPEKLIANPRKEIRRIISIFAERESRPHLVKKFDNVAKLLTLILLIPKVRRAFTKAIKSVEFKRMQLDEIDSFHAKFYGDYKFFGMTVEERLAKWPEIITKQYTVVDLHYNE